MSGGMYVVISDPETLSEFISGNRVVVKFGAEWCRPCLQIAPLVKSLAEHTGLLTADVNTDRVEHPEADSVTGLPTIRIYENGRIVSEVRGADPTAIKALYGVTDFKL